MQSRIFVTGASGFVAQALIPSLVQDGAMVFALVHKKTPEFPTMEPVTIKKNIIFVHSVQEMQSYLQKTGPAHLDAVIHLAGAGIGDWPWTDHRKAVLQSSRWNLITRLHDSMNDLGVTFDHVIGASAIGFYGNTGDELVSESASKGEGFSADLCEGIEQRLASVAQPANVKWHAMRIGVVLGPEGGVLARLALPARLGLGSVLGDGQNWLSWIDRDDLVQGILHLLSQSIPNGPVNMVSPHPVKWQVFSYALAGVFGKKSYIKVPRILLAPLGEMKRLFLDSVKVTPKVLLDSGFRFSKEDVGQSLAHNLGSFNK